MGWICVVLSTVAAATAIEAASSPFVIQQFNDTAGTWYTTFLPSDLARNETDKYIANCLKFQGNETNINITGEAYRSNGADLTNTIWLREPFTDPYTYRDTNITIERVNVSKADQVNALSGSHISHINGTLYNLSNRTTSKTRSGYPTTMYNYTSKTGSLMIVEKKPVFYIITFNAPNPDQFNFYWPKVKKAFHSFDLSTANGNLLSTHSIAELGMTIQPPADWFIPSDRVNSTVVITPDPWDSLIFGMTIQTLGYPSYGGKHSDYLADLEWKHHHWTQNLYQLSLSNRRGTPEEKALQIKPIRQANFSNMYEYGSHVDIPLDLSYIDSPDSYIVISSITEKFLLPSVDYKLKPTPDPCLLRKTTSWVALPPPKISLSTDRTSLTLRPGDADTIQVHTSITTAFPSTISLSAHTDPSLTNLTPQNLTFSPGIMYLSPSSPVGTSTLHIKAPPNIIKKLREFPLIITGNVSFPYIYTSLHPDVTNLHGPKSLIQTPAPVVTVDTTVNHPDISISVEPNSTINLRQGEQKNVQVVIKNNSHLPSEATLSSTFLNTSGVNMTLPPPQQRISISPLSVNSSTLTITTLENAESNSYPIPISTNFSFGRGGDNFSSTANLTLKVLPAYTPQERLSSFASSWITPFTIVWTFLAAVSAVVSPLVIRLYQKKKRQQGQQTGPNKKE